MISIEGTLLMLDDRTPHVAVPVQAVCDGEVIATTLSDERGQYQFTDLKRERYRVRCQVLGGYVYYGEERRGKRENEKAGKRESQKGGGRGSKEAGERGDGDILRVESGKTLKDIDFRFAPFKKGIWRNYSYLDGLVHDWIFSVYCDSEGILWFGSEIGVFRYDGKEFIHFAPKDGLPYGHLFPIVRDPDGIMWFGIVECGVCRYDGKEFVTFTTEDGLAYNSVLAIHCDPDGVLWFGTTEGGVSRCDARGMGDCPHFVSFTTEDGLVDNYVSAIYRDPDGVMWFGTRGGVSRYDGNDFVNFTTEDGLAHDRINAIHCDPDGVMWFATFGGWDGEEGGGLSLYDGNEFINLTTKDGLVHNSVFTIHCDPDGVMWFGTYGGGVSRYDGGTFVNFAVQDGLAGNQVYGIYCDPDGAMWFSTNCGVFRYDPNVFINFTTQDGLPSNRVNAIYRDPDGAMWFATRGGGVSRYDGKEFVTFTTEDGLAHNTVNDIYRDPDGILWFATGDWFTWGGISRYDGKEFVNFTTEDGLAHNQIIAIHRDPDGVMWFGTYGGGVSRYDGKEFVNLTTEDGLVDEYVNAIHRDPDGVMWFGTGWSRSRGGISRYDGNTFVNYTTKDGLAGDAVFAIHRDPDGVMWFGTTGGVSRYDGTEFTNFTREDGLAHNNVNTIYRDQNGVLWFGTDGGVSAYDGIAWASLDTRDGLSGRYVVSILQDPDGSLWFGTEGGVTRYRRSTTPPKVLIVSVTTDQTYRDLSTIPPFTPGTRVTIEYNAIDFKTISEKRQYRCRIKEVDPDWRRPTKAESFDFIFDTPGTYTFQVQAIDRDLNYSEPVSVELKVVPDPRNHRIIQLEEHIREQELAEMERMHQELEDARHIQQSLLPEKPPQVEGIEIAGISNPAKEVSGDFYSYLSLGDNIGIVLADVTGKSVKAAMVATLADGMLNEAVRERVDVWNSPCSILKQLNAGLHPRLVRGMFTAMSLGILQAGQKRLIFSNAGMPYPIVKRGNEAWELVVNGMPLGLVGSAEYEDLSIDLEVGDMVIFCSDGVIEATDEAGEMYQIERLLKVVQEADLALSAQEMVDLVIGDVTEFTGDVELSDDITVVVIRSVDDI